MFMHRRFVKLINKNVRDSLFSENKPFCKISSSVFIESSEIFYGKNGRLNTTFRPKFGHFQSNSKNAR